MDNAASLGVREPEGKLLEQRNLIHPTENKRHSALVFSKHLMIGADCCRYDRYPAMDIGSWWILSM